MFYTPEDDCTTEGDAPIAGTIAGLVDCMEPGPAAVDELLERLPGIEIVAKIGPLFIFPAGADGTKLPVEPPGGNADALPVEVEAITSLPEAIGAAPATESIETEPGLEEGEANPPFIVKFPHAMIVLLA